jgi:hypothetical protein
MLQITAEYVAQLPEKEYKAIKENLKDTYLRKEGEANTAHEKSELVKEYKALMNEIKVLRNRSNLNSLSKHVSKVRELENVNVFGGGGKRKTRRSGRKLRKTQRRR